MPGGTVEVVRAPIKRLLTPRMVGFHVLAWGAAVTMVFLGRWQLDVSDAKHFDLQNFGYAFQWWAFSISAVALWVKVVRDQLRKLPPPEVSTSGELVLRGPATQPSYSGPVQLMRRGDADGAEPLVYRGYRMPQSSDALSRSEDSVHGAYNDYLWQLSLADDAEAEQKARRDGTAADGSGESKQVVEGSTPAALDASEE